VYAGIGIALGSGKGRLTTEDTESTEKGIGHLPVREPDDSLGTLGVLGG